MKEQHFVSWAFKKLPTFWKGQPFAGEESESGKHERGIDGHNKQSPEQDSKLGRSRMAVFEDCQANTPTTQPLRLGFGLKINSLQFFCSLLFQ